MAIGSFDTADLVGRLTAAPDVEARWSVLTGALATLGLDQVNYGVLDTSVFGRDEAPVRFLSTMRADWLAYYSDVRLDLTDPHVVLVRQGNLLPYRWGESMLDRLTDPATRKTVELSVEAGLRGQISVTMSNPFGPRTPMGGMTLGSSLPEAELFGAIAGREGELVTIAHIFNSLSIGEVRRRHHQAKPLTDRQRECVRHLVSGRRMDAIAEKMGLSRVTVEMHLNQAKKKLGAATLPELVARALMFQEVDFD